MNFGDAHETWERRWIDGPDGEREPEPPAEEVPHCHHERDPQHQVRRRHPKLRPDEIPF